MTIRGARFEDLSATDGPFDLVVAAQSFHWADPSSRWSRLLDLLSPSGVAALFWNSWHLDPVVHELDEVRGTYERLAPDLVADLPTHELHPWPANEIEATGEFEDVRQHAYEWNRVLPTPEYVELLATTSQYAVMHQASRTALFAELMVLLGDRVHLLGATRLHLMRKAPRAEA